MRQITFRERFQYWFDNTMARGPVALTGLLALVSFAFIVLMAILVTLFGLAPAGNDGSRPNFFQQVWANLMRTLDAGTMGADTGSWGFLLMMLMVTLGGVIVVSSLIGIISSAFDSKVEQLRKGRSFVVEQDHTLILGWSPQIVPIISELVLANENRKKPCIVILADKDKVEMEDEIRDKISSTKNTRIICRSGSPIDLTDLEMVNPQAARSIIVLSPETSEPDSQVIKTVLALTNSPKRREETYHIVAEISDGKNLEAARLVGRDEAQFILADDLISRITVQTCRQSGLSVVYTELLDFGGDEIYFKEEPTLVGQSYAKALYSYDDSAVMGITKADGEILVNPPSDTKIEAGDQLICISQDDDTIVLAKEKPMVNTGAIVSTKTIVTKPERTLVLGWNRQGATIVNELEQYVVAGSSITVVANTDISDDLQRCMLYKQKASAHIGDTTDRRVLEGLGVTTFDHIIVLAYSDSLDPQQADAKTLITLLHLRDMSDRAGKPLSIVSEMLDNRNRELAEVTKADDFIVSDKLVSLMLSQISENKQLADVFRFLFSSEGSEIYLRPITDYVKADTVVNFYTVLESARKRGETAIGYRVSANAYEASLSYGVKVNPKKSEKITFSAEDKVIVLADN
jgi:voltage-gated potassium channel Kch